MHKKTIFGILSAIALCGCVSFNRDALWNASVPFDEYCTYYEEDFPIGSKFVHRLDDWTEYRVKWGYELKVIAKSGDAVLLRHGWSVFTKFGTYLPLDGFRDAESSEGWWHKIPRAGGLEYIYIPDRPIVVYPLHPENVKVGEFYTEYGQYEYEGQTDLPVGDKFLRVKVLRQLNESQELVAKPFPFFYCREWHGNCAD